MKKKNTI